MPKWTREKVAALKTSDLPKLRANAARNLGHAEASSIIAWCDEELSSRHVNSGTIVRRARPDDERNAEAEADAQLTALAKNLLAKYDLSPDTAKRLSQGIKGFRSLELIGKNGATKVGGLQRNGALALDRYVSYRRRNALIKMEYVLLNGRPIEDARWLVIAPLSLLPEGLVITEQMPGLKAIKGAFEGETGIVTNDFDQAAGAFASVVAEISSITN